MQMEAPVPGIALIAASYALGCVSTGYYLSRLRGGPDIRFAGSGSTGARNSSRILGNRAFVIVLAGDTAKGAVAVAAAALLGVPQWAVMAVMVSVLVGHLWPAQLGFRGGKGLAPALGALLVLDFRLALIALVVTAIVLLVSRHSVGSGLVAVVTTPFVAIILGHSYAAAATMLVMAALILVGHKENLRTIFAGGDAAPDDLS